ncbi:IclR family transcriptional regulator [Amycolatopsis rubida]|uniref:IclR family transcriptional regulator n=1 Tax=Amycolatopsis rubida TaxID=112413 RepID=A0ABX0C3J1_9PSEU|nr:IclR family transcriptional regulator [Amycolatopsis rubida]MYW96146.1 helix-turn-helix domain-containing protein [Amycolatopsis rubida]NEC61137.1 IclR family transcriptional regulator [Amycolatopsis rubida]
MNATAPNKDNPSAGGIEHRTVSRVMSILEVVIASEPNGLRLADLPDMLGAPKSSLHGLVRGLVANGYLRERHGRYYQGPATSLLALSGQRIPAALHHSLQTLANAWQETAILATLAGESVINIDKVESPQLVRASPPLHERRPMWPGSYGKVFLAFMSSARRDAYLRRKHKEPSTQRRILAELETIRTSGIAYNKAETVPDLYGIACPIRLGDGDVTLALGIAGPASRLEGRLEEVGQGVLEAARDLSTAVVEKQDD